MARNHPSMRAGGQDGVSSKQKLPQISSQPTYKSTSPEIISCFLYNHGVFFWKCGVSMENSCS